jgi:hypothetical protein
MYAQNRNITYIDDLPDLDDLEQVNVYQETIPDKYKKFIRNSSQLLPESGMVSLHNPQSNDISPQYKENNVTSMNCLDVHDHIIHCPICSKFFKFDNTVYIIAIVVLIIVCILLLKRVLDV